jgi:hypothetical protein
MRRRIAEAQSKLREHGDGMLVIKPEHVRIVPKIELNYARRHTWIVEALLSALSSFPWHLQASPRLASPSPSGVRGRRRRCSEKASLC